MARTVDAMHRNQPYAHIHVIISGTFADATARTAVTTYTDDEIDMIYKQIDDGSLWRVISQSAGVPVWEEFGRVQNRVGSATSSATPTINTNIYDVYKLTAQAVDITSFTTNLSGTPTDTQFLEIIITGTAARAITWGSSFVSSAIALPTTTVTTATLRVTLQYDSVLAKWVCVGVA
jgi:hypothetical protein